MYSISTPKNHRHQNSVTQISNAGIIHNKGHRYGMNSVRPAIRASDNLLGSAIPKTQSKRSNPTRAIIPIEIHKISCPLSQAQSLWYNLLRTFSNFSEFLANDAIEIITTRFSNEKNTARTSTIDAWTTTENIHHSILTTKVLASPIDDVHKLTSWLRFSVRFFWRARSRSCWAR